MLLFVFLLYLPRVRRSELDGLGKRVSFFFNSKSVLPTYTSIVLKPRAAKFKMVAYGLARRADSALQLQFSVHFATKTSDFLRSEFCGVLIRSGYEVVAKFLRRGRNPFIQPVLKTLTT